MFDSFSSEKQTSAKKNYINIFVLPYLHIRGLLKSSDIILRWTIPPPHTPPPKKIYPHLLNTTRIFCDINHKNEYFFSWNYMWTFDMIPYFLYILVLQTQMNSFHICTCAYKCVKQFQHHTLNHNLFFFLINIHLPFHKAPKFL